MRHPSQTYRRRRLGALAVLAVLAFGLGAGVQGMGGGAEPAQRVRPAKAAQAPPPPPPQLPRGGRTLFPAYRVVAYYGAPQDPQLGALGIGSPAHAGRRLARAAKPYARKTRPVLPAMELLATIANADAGSDGLYMTRQPAKVIDRYLRAARRMKALLVLDIQPGRADFLPEVRRLRRWLEQPDVGLALDPEWHVAVGQVPGHVIGSVDASVVNRVSDELAEIVRRRNLPEKLLLVHQFTTDMIRNKSDLKKVPGVALTINVDGFGDRPNKRSKYAAFTSEQVRFNDGFKLFYEEDTNLMRPRDVLNLQPPPDVVVYE